MASNLVMRQLDERQTEHEIQLLVYSPKMDILALALATGTVSLYRLQWQRIWAAPGEEGRLATALAWRPDGKLLAAGDSAGLVTVRHIEASAAIHTQQLDSKVTCLTWVSCPGLAPPAEPGEQEWDFLARLPSLSKTYSYIGPGGEEELEDCRRLDCGGELTVLLAGTAAGSIYVLVHGFLLAMRLTAEDLGDGVEGGVEEVAMTEDVKSISCVVGGRLLLLSCPLLSTCMPQLAVLAAKYSLVQGILHYTTDTIRQIREAWESILLEMDTKLTSYAENNPPGTVAADFLELLMFGVPSPQLETFLHKDMTEKGLKKLGQSIELSYSNIQRLVLRYLGAVSQSLNFHLGEMVGLARAGDRYPVLGVTEAVVEAALHQAQAFWAKGVELQQVIDESMKNFKAFFRWVYVEILKLGEENLAGDLSKVSQQDITFIAEFLKRFQPVESVGGSVSHLYLEKVGQYLEDKPLVQPPDNSANPWHQLLETHPEIQDVPFIIPVNTGTSLVQEHAQLEARVSAVFAGLGRDIGSQTALLQAIALPDMAPRSCRQQVTERVCVHGIASLSPGPDSSAPSELLLWRALCSSSSSTPSPTSPTSMVRLRLAPGLVVVDSSFYTAEYLALLVRGEGEVHTLLQLPLASLAPLLAPHSPTSPHAAVLVEEVGGARSRTLDNLAATQLAVSGPRKVSVFLFRNRKRIRIYDMEGEEEEEEDTLDSSGFSASMDVNSSQIG